jgi:D-beta-D-heptose 7-phosphate kinase/D-beta-D-heptose 1-phosphate adenosyltransferase
LAERRDDLELLGDARAEALLARFSDLHVLVVGDAFLDEYLYGDAVRVSPEAPVPVVEVERGSKALGGAANVVRNVVALGGACDFCCVVGDDASGDEVIELLGELGVGSSGVLRIPGRPTTHKTRVVARRQQIVRVDRETREPLAPMDASRLLAGVDAALPRARAVILEDYGKGLLTLEVGRAIMRAAGRACVPVHVDPKEGLDAFAGAALVKPNLAEAESISGLRASAEGGLEAVGRRLQKLVGGGDVAISQGGQGITIFEGERPGLYVPTVRREVFDVQGAGDTVIAALSLALLSGASLWEATVIAHAASSVVVGKSGTATADRGELLAALPAVRGAARAALLAQDRERGERP